MDSEPHTAPAAPETSASETPAPEARRRWFGRGIYGSHDVPIRALDAVIGLMIAAIVLLTAWNSIFGGFTVSFSTGLSDVTVAPQKVRYGQQVSEPEAPLRPGYTLRWWSTDAGGTAEWYFPAAEVTGDMTLYAVWEPASYTVTFDPAGGTGSLAPLTVTCGQPYGALPVPEKAGSTFAGWRCGSQTITADTAVTITGDHVLTAVWQ